MRPIATDVARSVVCVSVDMLGTQVSSAKTAEQIEIPFAGLTRVGPRNRVRWASRSYILALLSAFEISYKNVLYKFTVIIITPIM